MRVLVTGGCGFIGSHLVERLYDSGHDIRVIDMLTYAGREKNIPERIRMDTKRFKLWREDICSSRTDTEAMRESDAVIHLAAETHIDRSIDNVVPFVHSDFVGTATLLDALRYLTEEEPGNAPKRFIHVSTCEIYGSAKTVPMTEDHPIAPQSPYAATKAGADRMCWSYRETYKLPIVIVRPFNQYGPRQFPEKLIPLFYREIAAGRKAPVYGAGYNTRDWTFVPDFCECLEMLLNQSWPLLEAHGAVFNVGTGYEASPMDIVRIIASYEGKRVEDCVEQVPDRLGHVRRLVCDPTMIGVVTGWEPKTSFEIGIKKTLDWYRDNPKWWSK